MKKTKAWKKPEYMKNWFAKFSGISLGNKWLKIASLLIAVVCWYGIQGVIQSGSTVYETTQSEPDRGAVVTLPINVIAPTGLATFRIDLEPNVAKVSFAGTGHAVAGEPTDKISLVVDCSDIAVNGRYRLPVKYIAGAGDVIIDIDPATVIVQIEFVNDESIDLGR